VPRGSSARVHRKVILAFIKTAAGAVLWILVCSLLLDPGPALCHPSRPVGGTAKEDLRLAEAAASSVSVGVLRRKGKTRRF